MTDHEQKRVSTLAYTVILERNPRTRALRVVAIEDGATIRNIPPDIAQDLLDIAFRNGAPHKTVHTEEGVFHFQFSRSAVDTPTDDTSSQRTRLVYSDQRASWTQVYLDPREASMESLTLTGLASRRYTRRH